MLHQCPEIRSGRPAHSLEARERLVRCLTQYQDATGIPVTVVFDHHANAKRFSVDPSQKDGIEVLYAGGGKTADALIERITERLLPYGDVLVVTEDMAERSTVSSLGAMTRACSLFFEEILEQQNNMERLTQKLRAGGRRT